MTWTFNPPPGWGPLPSGFLPPHGWQPHPSWPPAPAGWSFWIDAADRPTARAEDRRLIAEDGSATFDDAALVLDFTSGRRTESIKAGIGVRVIPLSAIDSVTYRPPGSIRDGAITVSVSPGADTLRGFLKDTDPSFRADPDSLVVAPRQAAVAELFAAGLRDAAARSTGSGASVVNGVLPIEVKGADGTAVFDGATVTLEFGGWTADAAKKHLGRRVIPVSAILEVRVRHPGMSGWIRFVTVDAPTESELPAAKDPNTLCLNMDLTRKYAVLAAAVTRCLPSVAIARTPAPRPRPTAEPAPTTPAPVGAEADRLPYGLPDTVELEAEARLIRASGLRLVRLASLGEKTGIVGESHYQKALRKVARGRTVPPGAFDDALPALAVLVPEPGNRHDATAVRVDLLDVDGTPHRVGYLDRYRAAECHHRLARLDGQLGYCQARVMGGGHGRHYGAFLHWHPGRVEPVGNRHATGYLLDGDRWVTVTREAPHQDVLSRYAPGHIDGRTVVLAELAFTTVKSGKYTGQSTIEVRLDGERVGETTRHQAHKYEALLRTILDRGGPAVCESVVRRKVGQLEVELLLPSRF